MSDEAYDYGRLLVIEHEDGCPPDALQPTLDGRASRRPWTRVDLGNGDAVPELTDDVRGILVLGGTMGVPDADRAPWMDAELDLLRTAVDRGVPVFGICLGAQLLATALGGEVERRDAPEVGFLPLTRASDADGDEVFAGWPNGAYALLIHEDQVTRLPDGATAMLEGSDGVPAWRTSDGLSYGVQFHPETTADTLARWLDDEGMQKLVADGGADAGALLDEARQRERFVLAVGVSMVGRWLDGVVGRDDPTPRRRRS